MPIITDFNEVKRIYNYANDSGICLPVFAAEDRETIEAILAAGTEIGKEIGNVNIPIIITWTINYQKRPQMQLVSSCGDPVIGIKLMLSDLRIFLDKESPYYELLVMPHLDHIIPCLDNEIIEYFLGDFASILFDASEKSLDENIKLTSEFVKKYKNSILIEGIVDEIKESKTECIINKTTVENVKRYVQETGVDLIVPNVGTEHRSTMKRIKYDSNLAKKISSQVGRILSIHGTTSINKEEIPLLSKNGFAKVNIFTGLAINGGQAVAGEVLNNIKSILYKNQIKEFIEKGILSGDLLNNNINSKNKLSPKLENVVNAGRRDAWFLAVKETCKEYFYLLNYKNFKGKYFY